MLSGVDAAVTFTPNLVPMTRGILTAVYGSLTRLFSTDELQKIYEDYYASSPFVFVRTDGSLPATREVTGTNECHIAVRADQRAGRLVVISAIDNLIKGAAGQAIQNLNLMYGLDQKAGLELIGRTV